MGFTNGVFSLRSNSELSSTERNSKLPFAISADVNSDGVSLVGFCNGMVAPSKDSLLFCGTLDPKKSDVTFALDGLTTPDTEEESAGAFFGEPPFLLLSDPNCSFKSLEEICSKSVPPSKDNLRLEGATDPGKCAVAALAVAFVPDGLTLLKKDGGNTDNMSLGDFCSGLASPPFLSIVPVPLLKESEVTFLTVLPACHLSSSWVCRLFNDLEFSATDCVAAFVGETGRDLGFSFLPNGSRSLEDSCGGLVAASKDSPHKKVLLILKENFLPLVDFSWFQVQASSVSQSVSAQHLLMASMHDLAYYYTGKYQTQNHVSLMAIKLPKPGQMVAFLAAFYHLIKPSSPMK
nr:hypothetical protein Itr_chr13CG21550 [Ipomoea trifida]